VRDKWGLKSCVAEIDIVPSSRGALALVFEVTEKPGTGISFVDAVRILACTEATNPKQISPRNSSRTNCTDEEMLDQIR